MNSRWLRMNHANKKIEIMSLQAQLSAARTSEDSPMGLADTVETVQHDGSNEMFSLISRHFDTSTVQPSQKGKASPVGLFIGESSDVLWKDWLPTLEQTAT